MKVQKGCFGLGDCFTSNFFERFKSSKTNTKTKNNKIKPSQQNQIDQKHKSLRSYQNFTFHTQQSQHTFKKIDNSTKNVNELKQEDSYHRKQNKENNHSRVYKQFYKNQNSMSSSNFRNYNYNIQNQNQNQNHNQNDKIKILKRYPSQKYSYRYRNHLKSKDKPSKEENLNKIEVLGINSVISQFSKTQQEDNSKLQDRFCIEESEVVYDFFKNGQQLNKNDEKNKQLNQ